MPSPWPHPIQSATRSRIRGPAQLEAVTRLCGYALQADQLFAGMRLYALIWPPVRLHCNVQYRIRAMHLVLVVTELLQRSVDRSIASVSCAHHQIPIAMRG